MKFKKGDVVKIVKTWEGPHSFYDKYIGEECKILGRNFDHKCYILPLQGMNGEETTLWNEEELELATIKEWRGLI